MQNKTNILYRIKKENECIGYIFGSLHRHFNPQDHEEKKSELMPYVNECKTFFFEIDQGSFYTQMPLGIERIMQELLESRRDTEKFFFETQSFQLAMLNTRLWFGKNIIQLPWHQYNFIKNHDRLATYFNKIAISFFTIYNHIYNIFTASGHSSAVHTFNKEQQEILISLFNAYKQEEVFELNKEDQALYFIQERNHDYIKIIKNHIASKPFFICIGAGHLAGEHGMIKLLEKEGLELFPLTLKKEALLP